MHLTDMPALKTDPDAVKGYAQLRLRIQMQGSPQS